MLKVGKEVVINRGYYVGAHEEKGVIVEVLTGLKRVFFGEYKVKLEDGTVCNMCKHLVVEA